MNERTDTDSPNYAYEENRRSMNLDWLEGYQYGGHGVAVADRSPGRERGPRAKWRRWALVDGEWVAVE